MRLIRWGLLLLCFSALTGCPPTEQVKEETFSDLQAIQGTWMARWNGLEVRREILNNQEQVSYYDKKGLLTRSHVATIEVGRTQAGQAFLRWYNLTAVVGPKPAPAAVNGEYLYTYDGTRLVEYHGATVANPQAKAEIIEWTRIDVPEAQPL